MRALIVEDHAINRRLLRAQLEAENVTVLEAVDGAEALEVLARDNVDVVVSDILMPRIDGYRLCYELRANARWRTLPFIFYTATYTTTDDEYAASKLGADAFLRKPTSPEGLMEVIRKVVSSPRPESASVAEPDDVALMKVYNERLVAKLEERNIELEKARDELHRANTALEERVKQRTEQLETANKELESFAHFVSHELRAPVRSIDGFTGILRDDFGPQLPGEAQRMVGIIDRSAKNMSRLIDDLLRFAVLSRSPLNTQVVRLQELVREVIAELSSQVGTRQIDWAISDLPKVKGDAALLKVALLNLLGNAVKFTRERPQARIEVGHRVIGQEDVFHVRDNGAGFDMRHAERLFAPFERLHAADRFEGTGIGLGMVRNIIQRHGGRVWAEGAVNQGAQFYFTLERAG